MMKKGIDISHHNPNLDFAALKNKGVEFIMIRAGYGHNNIDMCFEANKSACIANRIPFGVYWFSYAYTPEMAKAEADYCCNAVADCSPDYPIAFDFEYGSLEYAKKHGHDLTGEEMVAIARAFLERVEERGYFAMIYTNRDFLRRGFDALIDRYALWLAEYNVENASIPCAMWQYGIDSELNLDGDYCYKDFPEKIANFKLISDDNKNKILESIPNSRINAYIRAARCFKSETLSYTEMLEKFRKLGIDFEILMAFVKGGV